MGHSFYKNEIFDPCSPIYRAPRAHPKFWPGAWQEVGEPVHYGWGHWQGSYVLVDLLQLTDNSAGHQLQHMMRKMEGHCCPLKEGGGVKCHRKGTNGYNKTSRKSSPEKEIYTCTSSKYCSYNKKHYKKIFGDQKMQAFNNCCSLPPVWTENMKVYGQNKCNPENLVSSKNFLVKNKKM